MGIRTPALAALGHASQTVLRLLGLSILLATPMGCSSFREYNEARKEEDGIHGPGVHRTEEGTAPRLEAFRVNQSF